ncbi:dephospho-CoA kinase [Lentilactobacillus laojiaonis]|uniref:dephospho-CoA kinase n=1 Tax=Lentilactobacillus laojiaonis TaxID=2883998 RepID=UPI001D09E6E2|nr:dephospho-CoA kinase [Lentilactobacillus laojiaonis]UDM32584.1 dephospho-CoA kinase [Lentilactobacillus laojiaonis]
MAKVIGITGGIATGKTLVSQYLISKGYFVIDADKATHDLQKKGTQTYNEILSHFGKEYLLDNGELNRSKLANLVFKNSKYLKILTQIVNKSLRQQIVDLINDHQDEEIIFLDAPTLYEAGYSYLVDKVMVVYCDSKNQFDRLLKRDGLTFTEANHRLKNQWSLDIKKSLADILINNNDTSDLTYQQIDQFLEENR